MTITIEYENYGQISSAAIELGWSEDDAINAAAVYMVGWDGDLDSLTDDQAEELTETLEQDAIDHLTQNGVKVLGYWECDHQGCRTDGRGICHICGWTV